jgi:hypothetical protein
MEADASGLAMRRNRSLAQASRALTWQRSIPDGRFWGGRHTRPGFDIAGLTHENGSPANDHHDAAQDHIAPH